MTIPQWEACKVCGGDHWTKDHGKETPTSITQFWIDRIIAERQAEAVAAERARIKAAVESLYLPFGDDLRLDRIRDQTLRRVLRIIEGESL